MQCRYVSGVGAIQGFSLEVIFVRMGVLLLGEDNEYTKTT